MQSVSLEDQQNLARALKSLDQSEAQSTVKVRLLGLELINVVGVDVLTTAVKSLGDQIRPAARDGQQHLFVLAVDPLATALNEGLSGTADESATSRGGRFMRSVSALLLLGWGVHPADCRWR